MPRLCKKLDKVSNWLMLLPLILGGVWFSVLEQTMRSPEHFMYTPMDDWIPFVPVFVIPYVLWYFYTIIPAVFLFFRSKDAFRRIAIFLSAGMCIACLVYTILPNGQFLRPHVLGTDWCSRLIGYLYLKDTPFNSAPSIHVIYSMGSTYAILAYNKDVDKRLYRILSVLTWTFTGTICLSTLFVKQHSVIDMVTGLGVGFLLYALIYKELYKKMPRPSYMRRRRTAA